jgi:hypothetical protein
MVRSAATALAVAALMAVALPTTDTANASAKACPNTYGGDVVFAYNMGCERALKVVRSWARGYKRNGVVDRKARGFQCRGLHSEAEGLVVKCHRGNKRVNFYANVP